MIHVLGLLKLLCDLCVRCGSNFFFIAEGKYDG